MHNTHEGAPAQDADPQPLDPLPETAPVDKPATSWSTRTPAPWPSTLAGAFIFLTLVSTCLLAPRLLPHLYLLFVNTGLPWRIIDFWHRKYGFFLIDFCYVVCQPDRDPLPVPRAPPPAAPPGHHHPHPHHPQQPQQQSLLWRGLEAGVYVVAEGPLAAALVAWRCSWVLGWADYTVSVFIHLLPGLAMAAHRHAPAPTLHGSLPAPGLHPHSTFMDALRSGSPGGLNRMAGEVCLWASQQPAPGFASQYHIVHEWNHGSRQLVRHLCSFSSSHAAAAAGSQLPPDPAAGAAGAAGGWAWAGTGGGVGGRAGVCHQRGSYLDVCCWEGWAVWLVAFPLACHVLWQAFYFLIVQVFCLPVIRSRRLDTSYKSLSRRAKKAGGGPVSAFVLQGSTARRLTAYGLVQFGFTLGTMVIGILSYHSTLAALAWQAFKFFLPLHAGWQDTRKAHAYARALKKKEKKA